MGKLTRSTRTSGSATVANEARSAQAKAAKAKAPSKAAKSSPGKAAAAAPTTGKVARASTPKPNAPTAKAAKSVVTPKIALAKLRRASAVKARAALASAPAANPAAAEAVKHAIEATEKSKRANATSLPLPAALLARPAPRQVLAKIKSKAQALPKRGVRLYDLRESHCRWVLDRDGQEPAFCGAPKVGSSSWCAAHRKIVYPRATSQDGAPANGKADRPAS